MNDLTNLISQIPENHKFLALALLFILSHADRAYRCVIAVGSSIIAAGGMKTLATAIWSGAKPKDTPNLNNQPNPTSSAPSNL